MKEKSEQRHEDRRIELDTPNNEVVNTQITENRNETDRLESEKIRNLD